MYTFWVHQAARTRGGVLAACTAAMVVRLSRRGRGSRAWGCNLRGGARGRRTSRAGAKRLGSHSGLWRKFGGKGLKRDQAREDVREKAR